jgi:hypothetical protein
LVLFQICWFLMVSCFLIIFKFLLLILKNISYLIIIRIFELFRCISVASVDSLSLSFLFFFVCLFVSCQSRRLVP